MYDEKNIGKIVRRLRGPLSLREFGEKCGISHTTIDNIEKGIDFRTGKPTQAKIATIQKIADACGVSISYIIGEGPITEGEPENGVSYFRNGYKMFFQLTEQQIEYLDMFFEACDRQNLKTDA